MTKMFKYYQLVGGNEDWKPVFAEASLGKESPTFVTVLALDTLLDDHPSREVLDAVKYEGPMYFDLDAASIEDSIAGGQSLLTKLRENGLRDCDFEIFLSGKKGLHFLIPMVCFCQKPQPTAKLPAIYKEIAFKLAVETVDFRVYTARKGRMLRTCFNIRENGNYRVPVSAAEVESLTAESYAELCKAPRVVEKITPTYCPQFGMLYEAAHQKIAQIKKRKAKVVDAAELRKQSPVVQQILKGENLADIGFNKLAIQLAVFARESNWTEDVLVENAKMLCEKHQSDGRYNTPRRREAELRRMFSYIADNAAYEYDAGMLKSCLQRETISIPSTDEDGMEVEGEYEEVPAFTGGVQRRLHGYIAAKNADEEVTISNFVLRPALVLRDPKSGQIVSIECQTQTGVKFVAEPRDFTSSSALQNRLGPSGHSFTGTDTHARGIYSIMLREAKDHAYVVDSEGMNFLKVPAHPNKLLASTPFLAWADRDRVIVPSWVQEQGLNLTFQGYPDERGIFQTDLTSAEPLGNWLEVPGNRERLQRFMKLTFACANRGTVAKILGWMIASHYKQLFQATYGKFPLLHVYGLAGLGKTEFTSCFLHLFYLNSDPVLTTPSSTPFAFLSFVGGSASIPVVMDEWKPAAMPRELVEKYRGIFRDAYNGKETQRGGGTRTIDKFGALNRTQLSAPIAYIAEAAETETAIVERSVMVAFRRSGDIAQNAASAAYAEWSQELEILSVLGRQMAADILANVTPESFREDFGAIHGWAVSKYRLVPGDEEKLAKGELSQQEYDLKISTKDRPVYNNSVALFGLVVLRRMLTTALGDLFDQQLMNEFKQSGIELFKVSANDSVGTQAEYVKVMCVMSDMTRMTTSSGDRWLVEGQDYNLSETGGKAVLVLAARFAYNKYRQFCRTVGTSPMYPGDSAFEMALREVPAFMHTGRGTVGADVATAVFDLEMLQRSGVPIFAGKAVKVNK